MDRVDPIKIIESFTSMYKIVQTKTKESREGISYQEGACTDVEHALELCQLNAVELCKAAKELRDHRRTRRHCKDMNELLTPLFDYFNKNHRFFDGLSQVQCEVQKRIEQQNNRRYNIRVREDLRGIIEKVQTK